MCAWYEQVDWLCSNALCYAMLRYAMLRYAMLCYAQLFKWQCLMCSCLVEGGNVQWQPITQGQVSVTFCTYGTLHGQFD